MEKKRSHLRLKDHRSRGLFTSLLFSFALSALLSIVFLVVMALFSYKSDDPTALITPFSYASLALSALAFGFFSAKMSGRSMVACGLLSGSILSSLLLLFGVLSTDNYNFFVALPVIASIVVVSLFGSFLGSRQKSKRRYRTRA